MKANRELRREARELLRTKWFWRILAVGIVLNFIQQSASMLVTSSFRSLRIETWTDFLLAKVQAESAGLGFSVPNAAQFWSMTEAAAFEIFIVYVFASIAAFGFAGALLKATRNEERRWFADAFEGFRRPLETAWLMILMNLKVTLWSLLFVFPGIVAAYRYRQSWYLKSEHREWSASECLAESGRRMRGYKYQAFALDCSLLPRLLLAVLILGASALMMNSAVRWQSFLGSALACVGTYCFLYAILLFFVARSLFYRELPNSCVST